MKRRLPIFVCLVLALATAVVVGVVFLRSRNRATAERATREERASLAAKRRALDEQLAAAERQCAGLRSELDRLAVERAQSPPTPPLRPRSPPQPPSPEQVASQNKQFKARLAVKYAAFYRTAGLDEAMIRRFEQLLADRDAQENDLWTIAHEMQLGDRKVIESIQRSDGTTVELRMERAIAETRRQQLAQFEADQLALLGEADYRRLQEFRRDEGKRLVVTQLVSELTLTPASLTPAQSAQFGALLQGIDFGGKLAPGVAEWPEILARAQSLLTAPQLAALKRQSINAEHQAAKAALTKLVEQEGK